VAVFVQMAGSKLPAIFRFPQENEKIGVYAALR